MEKQPELPLATPGQPEVIEVTGDELLTIRPWLNERRAWWSDIKHHGSSYTLKLWYPMEKDWKPYPSTAGIG